LSQALDPGKLHAFLSGLKRELEAFRQFHQILSAEHEALVGGEADALVALAQRKNERVIELTQLADARNRYLTETTGSTNQIGMEAWLDSYDAADRHRAGHIWRELIDLARLTKELNQRNGQLIHTQLTHNQQALSVLLGANAGTSNLYGADGQAYSAKPPSSGRPLGKA
jgi:flagella synthesis protein FlgN